MSPAPDYGIDAPGVVRAFAIGGMALLVAGLVAAAGLQGSQPQIAGACFRAGLWWGGAWLLTATILFWSSRVGKLRVCDRLLSSLRWTGHEHVLDVGCGRGLALIGAAKRLTTGKAVGVDAGNQQDATAANVLAERMQHRVRLRTADARDLPFPSASFDIVISMNSIHNIKDAVERTTALEEMLRVLKPGGQLAIFDILYAGTYAKILRELGALEVRQSGPVFLWCLPGRRVTARKRD